MTTTEHKVRADRVYNTSVWPDFVPGVRVSRCGLGSTHGPHYVDVGPDQPRNCPGMGTWVECPNCNQLVLRLTRELLCRHQVDGLWCDAEANRREAEAGR